MTAVIRPYDCRRKLHDGHGQRAMASFSKDWHLKNVIRSSASFSKNWPMIALQICKSNIQNSRNTNLAMFALQICNANIAKLVFLEFWMFDLQICNAIIGQFFEKLADDRITFFKCQSLEKLAMALCPCPSCSLRRQS